MIDGTTLRLPSGASGSGAAGGSSAERALVEAHRAYRAAVRQLAEDAAARESEDVLELDQKAVDLAASRLAEAQAALARERSQAAARREEQRAPASGTPDRRRDELDALLSAAAVDTYA